MKKGEEKLKKDRKDTLMRIPIFIVSGIILYVWGFFILCFALIQLILILSKNKRNKELLRMSDVYLVQLYIFVRYITFLSYTKPFPFEELKKDINKIKD